MPEASMSTKRAKSPLGRLSSFGLQDPGQIPFLLPEGWHDYRQPLTRFSGFDPGDTGEPAVLQGHLRFLPDLRREGKVGRLVGRLYGEDNHWVGFVAFGDTRDLQKRLDRTGTIITLAGRARSFQGQPWLHSIRVVEPEWLGRVQPRYLGKPRTITPETTRERVLENLDAMLPRAAGLLTEAIGESEPTVMRALGLEKWSLEKLLRTAHLPSHPEQGRQAQTIIERLAAWAALRDGRRAMESARQTREALPLADLDPLLKGMPFPLTGEQRQAVEAIRADLGGTTVMRRLLSGDVGSGKTAVFAAATAGVVAAGGRVAILAPGEVLAEQIHGNITRWWPELAETARLVTGSTPESADLTQSRWLIGTTALLFRDTGRLDAVVVDEQQRFSREQREALGEKTHLLEATATCIPRSLALIQYAGMPVSRLRQIHVDKHIDSRILTVDNRQELFQEAKDVLARGEPLIVVYPRRKADEEEDPADSGGAIDDVETAALAWEKIAPGQVRVASGARAQKDNIQAVADIRSGAAKVLVATTVVEVGIDLPNLRTMIVVRPDRLGLTSLHQLRGRLARTGGEGRFLMYLPVPVKDATMERLQIMERETDGFRIAQADLMQRGFGDLDRDSERQTGSGERLLFGRPLTPAQVEGAIDLEDRVQALRAPPIEHGLRTTPTTAEAPTP